MSKTALLVIAKKIFRDEEYFKPKEILETAGIQVTTASTESGLCEGKLGSRVMAEISLEESLENIYDAVIFIGGSGATVYIDNPIAKALIDNALSNSKVLAAICLAPSILAHCDILCGIRATAWEDQKQDLVEHGAIWDHCCAVTSIHSSGTIIITGNGPSAATEFGNMIKDCMLK